MSSRLIPRDHWRQELDSLSRSHEGWIVRVAVTEPGGHSQLEVHDTPLQGVAAELGREPIIAVMVGDPPDTHPECGGPYDGRECSCTLTW